MSIKKSETVKFLEKLSGGAVTLGGLIESIRLSEEMSQAQFSKHLKISRSHLNDIEKGNKSVSPERASRFAKLLGHSENRFVELSLQSIIDHAGLNFKVAIEMAS